MTYPFRPGSFDFIAAVATLHHLPLGPALERLRDLLRPGGVIAIVGLYRAQTLADFAVDAAAFSANWAIRAVRGYFEPPTRKQDASETLDEIRSASSVLMPGSELKRLLFFRYFMRWQK